jgi:hypothetical protein
MRVERHTATSAGSAATLAFPRDVGVTGMLSSAELSHLGRVKLFRPL